MPDYTSILRRSISALPDAAPAMREAVYQRARAALARQLTAVDPPLSTREIEAQHQQLEDAVALIETEYAPTRDYGVALGVGAPPGSPPGKPQRSEPVALAPLEPIRRDPDFDADADLGSDDGDPYDRDDDYEDEPSRAPFFIGLAVIALLLIGGAAFLYAQRDLVAGWTGLPIGSEPAAIAQPPPEPTEPEVAAMPPPRPPPPSPADNQAALQKRPDRLTNGEEVPDLAPEDNAEAEPPGPDALPLGDQAQVPSGLAAESGAGAPPAEAPGTPPPGPAPAEPVLPAPPAPGQSIVAQRAIFYEQGSEGAPGQAWQGSVSWAQVAREDGSPAIQAMLELPDQNVTATISISKNSDETLPASHLVEIEFSGAGRLGPAAVERVPALVLKPNEQARGQPLSGAAVPVTENLFWIALSSEDEQIQRNLALLREGSWFDLPILFAGGQRALITFEKGIPGDKVFEAVLGAWGPSP